MRKTALIIIAIVIGVMLYTKSASAVSAASLQFDKATYSAAVGSTITVGVLINPGTDPVSSSDVHITYDAAVIQPISVTPGTYFPSVTNTIASGNVSIYGTVNDAASSKTGNGTIATVTFNVLSSGTTTLKYFCDTSSAVTSSVIKYEPSNINAPNVIVCSQNGTATVTGGSGSSGGSNPLATPTPPTSLPSTGTVENLSLFSIIGAALLVAGGLVKFLL
jgi:LPXTG-motif cell wall-anchored protein